MRFCSRKEYILILSWLLLTRLVLNIFIPLIDPSEARYSVIARNMMESGNYLEPQFIYNGIFQKYEGKPALVFQLSALSCKVFGANPFALRIPAFLAGVLIVSMVHQSVQKLRDVQTARMASILCAVSVVFYLYSGLLMIDLVLAACVTTGILAYTLFCSERKAGLRKKLYSIVYFVALAIGMVVKGPVVLVMAGFPVFLFVLINKRWQELRQHAWISGTFIFLLLTVPWYWLMTLKNPDFLEYFFLHENLGRFLSQNYGDRFGAGRETFRGMALIWFCIVNLPTLFFLPLIQPFRKKFFTEKVRLFSDPLVGLSLLTVLGVTFFWSLTSRSLIYYLLPTIPFLAIFIAVRHTDSGLLRLPELVRALRFGMLTAIIFPPFFLLIAAWQGMNYSDKMPARVYAELQEQEPQSIYFACETPFSADFYLAKRVVAHPSETLEESLRKSKGKVLCVPDDHRKKFGKEIPRKLLFHRDCWNVYEKE